ncbi:MAG: hypothetical protein CM15mP65_01500 [Crocinitomicaceae bacterium]|nr:MAG: hypothetical protein CM15mP65_01500 [Crocinitomicaceae bacterium]
MAYLRQKIGPMRKKKYYDALEIKPLENYPKNQLELIANNLKDEAQQSIKSQYDELIKKEMII